MVLVIDGFDVYNSSDADAPMCCVLVACYLRICVFFCSVSS